MERALLLGLAVGTVALGTAVGVLRPDVGRIGGPIAPEIPTRVLVVESQSGGGGGSGGLGGGGGVSSGFGRGRDLSRFQGRGPSGAK
jgi:hypothetical protein